MTYYVAPTTHLFAIHLNSLTTKPSCRSLPWPEAHLAVTVPTIALLLIAWSYTDHAGRKFLIAHVAGGRSPVAGRLLQVALVALVSDHAGRRFARCHCAHCWSLVALIAGRTDRWSPVAGRVGSAVPYCDTHDRWLRWLSVTVRWLLPLCVEFGISCPIVII